MDHSEPHKAQKSEPSLEPTADAFSAAPPLAAAPQPDMEAGDLPAWLSNPPAAPGAGERWGRRFLFLGGALLTVGVAAGGTMLALDLYESHSSMAVVAQNAPAAAPADTLPFIEKRPVNVPPLVLLPPDPAQQKAAATAAAAAAAAAAVVPAAATAAAAPPVPAPPVPAHPAKLVAQHEKPIAPVPAAPPMVAKKGVKSEVVKSVKVAAQAVKKSPPAAKPKLVVAAKKPVAAKRPGSAHLAKAQPRVRPVKGTMLPPSRDRSSDRAEAEPAPRAAIDRRCRPGELARECAARMQ